MIIVLIGLLAVSASVKWPDGLKEKAGAYDLKRGVRLAQHMAMTRTYDPAMPWGIEGSGTAYSVRQKGGPMAEDPGGGTFPRILLGGASFLAAGAVWFNRFGEPIDASGAPLSVPTVFTLSGGNLVTVHPETGYAE